MTGHDLDSYSIRRLWPPDFSAFLRHLKRLDPETRRSRFGSAVNDDFLATYALTANRLGTLVYGAFEGGEIHASAELRPLDLKATAEAAFTVEKHAQDHGLGSELMDRVITAAQNRRIGQLHMICLRENGRMQHLAEKFGARLKIERGEVTGQIEPAYPTPVSLLDETMREAAGFVTAVLDWRM
jgi:RimJ/RimL family protein N-acetyltransferase